MWAAHQNGNLYAWIIANQIDRFAYRGNERHIVNAVEHDQIFTKARECKALAAFEAASKKNSSANMEHKNNIMRIKDPDKSEDTFMVTKRQMK